MPKFYGIIGYSITEDNGHGVWTEKIEEKYYTGDIIRNYKRNEHGVSINDDLYLNNTISIVADAYAYEHFSKITYVKMFGSLWKVTGVEVQRPRLILSIGGLYNAG